jgi:hypothetical protein
MDGVSFFQKHIFFKMRRAEFFSPFYGLFLEKKNDFCWEKQNIFQKWGLHTSPHPMVATWLPILPQTHDQGL